MLVMGFEDRLWLSARKFLLSFSGGGERLKAIVAIVLSFVFENFRAKQRLRGGRPTALPAEREDYLLFKITVTPYYKKQVINDAN